MDPTHVRAGIPAFEFCDNKILFIHCLLISAQTPISVIYFGHRPANDCVRNVGLGPMRCMHAR